MVSAAAKEMILIQVTVTAPPNIEMVPNPACGVLTSGENATLASCWMRMLSPKVARMEMKRSLSTMRKMTTR